MRKNIFFRRKRGSALILSIIILMIMVILCSTIMAFTLANFRMSEDYNKVQGGYYSSEKQLETGLKSLQDILKGIEDETRNYITSQGFTKKSTDASPYDPPTTIAGFKKIDADSTLNQFYDATADEWNHHIKGKAQNPDGSLNKVVASNFLNDVYTRYYFLLVHDLLYYDAANDAKLMVDSGSGINYNNYFRDNILGSNASSYSLSYGSGFSDINTYKNDATTDIYDNSGKYDPKDSDTALCNAINIKYIKKADRKVSGRNVDEENIGTKLVLKVPNVNFIVSNTSSYVSHIGNNTVLMDNAITTYKNIIVKDNGKAEINGDMYAAGKDLESGDTGIGYDSNGDHSLTDMNAGGVRVGTIAGTTSDATQLTVNGNVFTKQYVHTLGKKAVINVGPNSGGSVVGFTGLKGALLNSSSLSGTISSPTGDDNYTFTHSSGGTVDVYRPKGGDVYCKNLATEETADNSKINVTGRTLFAGNIEADAIGSGLSASDYSIHVTDKAYGINSGVPATGDATSATAHSVIVENDQTAKVKFDSPVYVPATAWLKISELASGSVDFQTGESITVGMDETIQAYENESKFLKYLLYDNQITGAAKPTLPAGGALVAATDSATGIYKPFDIYDFEDPKNSGYLSDADISKAVGTTTSTIKAHQFLSYFGEPNRLDGLGTANIEINGGYVEGIALVKNGTGTAIQYMDGLASSRPEDSKPAAQKVFDTWYKPDDTATGSVIMPVDAPSNPSDKTFSAYKTEYSNLHDAIAYISSDRTDNDYYTSTTPKLNLNKSSLTSVDKTDALLSKKTASDTEPLIIRNHLNKNGVANCQVCIGTSDTTGVNFDGAAGGVIVTDRDIEIEPGVSLKGAIITSGNVIFDSGAKTTITYDNSVVSATFAKYASSLARAVGASVSSVASASGDIQIKGSYHSGDNFSRFTRTEWKLEN